MTCTFFYFKAYEYNVDIQVCLKFEYKFKDSIISKIVPVLLVLPEIEDLFTGNNNILVMHDLI